ncbi:hypothetical protein MICAH_1690015 [Microcystis aeruginosa PCC 9809]|uniref:Uncharacterized protein n=1 Tax=Microcystis aeruginosa PCC 9809 TaxID=1160285 RepID=I4HJI9_MICAE|nr:hypothetical protein MICAH_1690015 [Microcystis aeruginosa PCC 9809]
MNQWIVRGKYEQSKDEDQLRDSQFNKVPINQIQTFEFCQLAGTLFSRSSLKVACWLARIKLNIF